jgi:hypothetical protein
MGEKKEKKEREGAEGSIRIKRKHFEFHPPAKFS